MRILTSMYFNIVHSNTHIHTDIKIKITAKRWHLRQDGIENNISVKLNYTFV